MSPRLSMARKVGADMRSRRATSAKDSTLLEAKFGGGLCWSFESVRAARTAALIMLCSSPTGRMTKRSVVVFVTNRGRAAGDLWKPH